MLISIIIPTYNHALYLKEALDSIKKQTYTLWEVIIINNYSNDNTIEIINSFNEPRFQIINYKNNGNVAASRNLGVKLAGGDFIAFLDSDDKWCVNKLEKSVEVLKKGFPMICHRVLFRDSLSREFTSKCAGNISYSSLLLKGNSIIASSVVVLKSLLEDVGGFTEEYNKITAEDYHLWIKIAKFAKIKEINQVLGINHLHEGNLSKDVERQMMAELSVINEFAAALNDLKNQKRKRYALVYYSAGRAYYKNENYKKSISNFKKSFYIYPFQVKLLISIILCLIKYYK